MAEFIERAEKESSKIRDRDKRREIILNFGKTGFGKTVLNKYILIKKFPRVLIIDPNDEYKGLEFNSLNELIEYVEKHQVYKIKIFRLDWFEQICEIVLELGNVTLLVDEAQRVLPVREKMPEVFQEIVFQGRHKNINLILTSQRPSKVNIDIRSQFSKMFLFNQTEKKDIDWIEDVSFDVPEISNLSKFEYYEITPDSIAKKQINIDKIFKK